METTLLIFSMVVSCALVIITIPPIVRVARAKNLVAGIDERTVHSEVIPTLGGIGMFIGISLSTLLFSMGYPIMNERIIIVGMIMLLFVGIKDDIVLLSTKTKFSVQFLVAALVVIIGDFRITSGHGILGLMELNYFVSISLSIFIVMIFINAYNLIDGVDGLAAGLGILASLFFGAWFHLNGYDIMALFSMTLVGSLIGFLWFNLFGKKYKTFMGDTGSLILGLLIAVQVINFTEFNLNTSLPYYILSSPSIALAFVIIPLVDTLRVFVGRMGHGMSPFTPDNNHIHHRMLNVFNRHYKVTLAILALNIMIIVVSLMLIQTDINRHYLFFIILLLGVGATVLPGALLAQRKKKSTGGRILKTQYGIW